MEWLKKLRQHLLTGVSFAIPFIACGGILIAFSLAFAPMTASGPNMDGVEPKWLQDTLKLTLSIGVTSFTLMLPILAAYIAYSIAGKPGLVAGAIGGMLAGHVADAPKTVSTKVLGSTTELTDAVQAVKAAAERLAHIAGDGSALDAARGAGSDAAKKMASIAVEGGSVHVTNMVGVGAGFLGALAAGLLAGYLVAAIKKMPVHKFVKPIMPILIVPVISSLIVGVLMLKVIGPPIADALTSLGHTLASMQTGSAVLLALLLGAMIAFDMGGPVNKAAFFFASGLIAEGNYGVMGPVAAAICTPPLGMGLATLISRRLWGEEQRESGLAALGMGMIGITEGAIPFAAADPLRVIPCIMLGSMVASTTAMLGHVGDHAPHGGPIVLPVVDNRLMYVVAIVLGTVVTAVAINTLKRVWRAPGERDLATT